MVQGATARRPYRRHSPLPLSGGAIQTHQYQLAIPVLVGWLVSSIDFPKNGPPRTKIGKEENYYPHQILVRGSATRSLFS